MAETIQPVSIARETRERYLRYALSVITARALPDVRDGLKPVQRRILYAMEHELHLRFDGRPAKCARIVGDVMGKFHPHGDSAIYDALVRMTQSWVMRVPLIHGQGNFGSVDGDPPAAYRYTEAKLAAAADLLLNELNRETVELRPTYNNESQEPVVLPAQFPNLLVNGCSGIAVGLATNMPPHHFGEVLRAAIHLIDEPKATTAELLNKVKGPDFPLGGKIVTDRATLRKIYEDGEGSIKVQGEWKVEESTRGKQTLVVTSIPYGVDKGALERTMGEIIADKKLPGVLSLANESNDKEGLRIAMEIKPGTDAAMVMAYFYKHTDLQKNFAYNMTCLVPTTNGTLRPERLGLKAILQHFLDFRLETVRKRFQFDLRQLRRRIHILEGFRKVFDGLDRALKLIRESHGKADASVKLQAEFKLDEEQATAILDAQIYKLAQLEIQKILDELKEKKSAARKIEDILSSEKKLWGVVKDELTALEQTDTSRRKTRMASDEDVLEFDEEAYIVRENTNVVLTRDGWIKRVGRLTSVESTRVREGDEVAVVVPASTLDHVVFFADDGTAYTMRVNEIPASSGYGEPLSKFFKLADQVKIVSAVSTDERFTPADLPSKRNGDPTGPFLLIATSEGLVVRTPLTAFRQASTKAGRRYVKLDAGSKVVFVSLVRDEPSVMLASASGRVVHFLVEQVSVLTGVGKGVVGIKLDKDDVCLGGSLIGSRFDALRAETSGGKIVECRRGAYPPTHRGGKGTEVIKRSALVRVIPPAIELTDWDTIDGKDARSRAADKSERNGNSHANGVLFD